MKEKLCFSNDTDKTDKRRVFEIGHYELGKIRHKNLNTMFLF